MSWFSMIPSKTVVSRRTSLRIIMKHRNDFSCVVGCLAVTKRVLRTTDSKLLFLNIYTFLKIIGKMVVSCHFDFYYIRTTNDRQKQLPVSQLLVTPILRNKLRDRWHQILVGCFECSRFITIMTYILIVNELICWKFVAFKLFVFQ